MIARAQLYSNAIVNNFEGQVVASAQETPKCDAQELQPVLELHAPNRDKMPNVQTHKLQEWEDYYNMTAPHSGPGADPLRTTRQKTRAGV